MADSLLLIKFAGLIRSGVSLERALEIIGGMPEDKEFRYLLTLAKEVGASVSGELEQVTAVLGQREKALDKLKVNQAGPRASSRLVIWLPVITLGLAQLTGLDVVAGIINNPVVLLSLSFGFVLLGIAKLISNRMVDKAKPAESHTGLLLLGVALATSGGANLGAAKRSALNCYRSEFDFDPSKEELSALAEIEMLVTETGARVGVLLRRQAAIMQSKVLTDSEIVIERLSVKLLLPLGLVVLPAFVFITLVPLMVSMVGSV